METIPFSRAAAESWADIFNACDAGMIEPFLATWGCPNNPFIIEVTPQKKQNNADNS